MTQPMLLSKLVGETITVTFNFAEQMQFGETIPSIASVVVTVWSGVDNSPSSILTGGVTPSGTTVSTKVTLGRPGVIYTLRFHGVGSTGAIYYGTYRLAVLSDTGSYVPSSVPSLTGDLPDGVVGAAYSANLAISGGYMPYTPDGVSAGTSPEWMGYTVVDATLVCAGTSSSDALSSYTFSPQIRDAAGTAATNNQVINLTRTTAAGDLGNLTLGASPSFSYTASLGTAPYTFSLVGGALPTGLTLNSDGSVTGTTTAAGTFSWTIRATDVNNITDDHDDSNEVLPLLIFASVASQTYLRYSQDSGLTWDNTVETGGAAVTADALAIGIGNGQLERQTPIAGRVSPDGLTNYQDCVVPGGTGFPLWIIWSGTEWLRRSAGGLQYSADGITFLTRVVPSIGTPNVTYRSVAKLGNVIVSSYVSGSNRGILSSQDNGATWAAYTRASLSTGYSKIIALPAPYNYFLGYTGSSGRVDQTTTGVNDAAWTNSFGTVATPNEITMSAYNTDTGRLLAISYNNAAVHYSDDGGVTWVATGVGFGTVVAGTLEYLQGKFILVIYDNVSTVIRTSVDGITWTTRYSANPGAIISQLVSF